VRIRRRPFPSRVIRPALTEAQTHLGIDPRLCGTPVALAEGRADVVWRALPEMAADAQGLVHGGFVFGLADYAGMLAVNHPNVVIGAAELRFLRPVVVGDELVARARQTEDRGKKKIVEVEVCRGEQAVLTGVLTCFVPDNHVLAQAAG